MTATEPSQPLTDAELADIEARWQRYVALRDPDSMETSVHDVPDLLAEVDWLRAENAALGRNERAAAKRALGLQEENSALLRKLEDQYRHRAQRANEVTRLRSENAAARELHEPAPEAGQGYDENGRYTYIEPCCRTCGTADEYAVRWPCSTAKALGMTKGDNDELSETYRRGVGSDRESRRTPTQGRSIREHACHPQPRRGCG